MVLTACDWSEWMVRGGSCCEYYLEEVGVHGVWEGSVWVMCERLDVGSMYEGLVWVLCKKWSVMGLIFFFIIVADIAWATNAPKYGRLR